MKGQIEWSRKGVGAFPVKLCLLRPLGAGCPRTLMALLTWARSSATVAPRPVIFAKP